MIIFSLSLSLNSFFFFNPPSQYPYIDFFAISHKKGKNAFERLKKSEGITPPLSLSLSNIYKSKKKKLRISSKRYARTPLGSHARPSATMSPQQRFRHLIPVIHPALRPPLVVDSPKAKRKRMGTNVIVLILKKGLDPPPPKRG